jgi:hypothetical protein
MVRPCGEGKASAQGRVAWLDSSGKLGAQVLLVAELIRVVGWLLSPIYSVLFWIPSFNQCALVSHYFPSVSLYQ